MRNVVRQINLNLTPLLSGIRSPIQRFMALFLIAIFAVEIIVPPASAVAADIQLSHLPKQLKNHVVSLADQTTIKERQFDYPGGMRPVQSKNQAAADAAPTGRLAAIQGATDPAGEALQAPSDQPKITPHELTDLRTATTDTVVNANGSITKRNYFQPQYFKSGNKWDKIDTTLSQDTNPDDSSNIFGQALGKIQSWLDPQKNFTVTQNDWRARFSPSSSSKGMVRIQYGDSQVGFSPINAASVDPIVVTDTDGTQTVHYDDLWPGVDVVYRVQSDAIKENIVLKNKSSTNSVGFKILGAKLVQRDDHYVIDGALDNQFAIAAPTLMLNKYGPDTKAGALTQSYKAGILTVTADQAHLQTLPDTAFPAVIDPTSYNSAFGTRTSGTYTSFKSDGYVCQSTVCNPYAGYLYDSNNVLRSWRTAMYAPYTALQGHTLVSASLHLLQRTNAGFWTGTTDTHTFYVGYASCTNGWGCLANGWNASGTVSTSGNINVTSIYQNRIAANDWGASLFLGGEDGTTSSFKNFDPGTDNYTSGSYVAFTYTGTPPPTPNFSSPAQPNQVYTDQQPSFGVDPQPNPNGSTPLQYQFRLSSANVSGPTGTLLAVPFSNSYQWTVPDNILQDGTTYYIQAMSYDSISGMSSSWTSPMPFVIDMRLGNDKSQTYDTLGPVSVDLATGNLSTSAASHISASLGGSLGISMDYNSPLRSRNGLVGQYWANTTRSGAAALTRVDSNVDFDWSIGNPGISISDNFTAEWTGYFVAPQDGTYYFGAINDDSLTIKLNNQQVYSSSLCLNPPTCFGSAVTLTAGQVLPIVADYGEGTGSAKVQMHVKTPDGQDQTIPAAWLQTGVRSAATPHGLTGSYYARLDGTNNFSAANYLVMKRLDPLLSFDWGTSAPMPGGPTDFLASWSGIITLPSAATYYFGTNADDGSRIKIDGNSVMDNWTGACCTLMYGSGVSLAAGQHTITVDMYDSGSNAKMYLYVKTTAGTDQVIPSDWLTPTTQVLPDGWQLSLDSGAGASYDRLKVNQNSVTLLDSSGATHEYAWTGSGYKPPVNENGNLVRNADGTFTLQDSDGRTYVFNVDGTISSVTSAADDRNPAALQYVYGSLNGGPVHLTQITDGVDASRNATIYYSGQSQCGSAPASFDANAPAGMVCAVATNDGRMTYLYYMSGQLARITKPGNEITDMRYEQVLNGDAIIGSRLQSVRNSLAMDVLAAGERADDDTLNTTIAYDTIGRVQSVAAPAPTAGATREQDTIEYLPGIDKTYFGMTREHVVGASEPNGYTRRVQYDSHFRTIADTDITNKTTTTQWDDNKDLVYSVTDRLGNLSTTIYDDEDRPVTSYGPAPVAWFDTSNPKNQVPLAAYTSQVPRSDVGYDQTIVGPAVAWFDYTKLSGNTSGALTGAPKIHATGINAAAPGTLSYDFASPPITAGVNAQGIGFSATGKLRLPTGSYTVSADTSDGIRVWVDDVLVLDQWVDGSYRTVTGTAFTATAGTPKRLRIDIYRRTGSTGTLNIKIAQSGGFGATTNWSTYLNPDYSLPTSTTSYDTTVGNTTATVSYGTSPELGLPQTATADPTGLNLMATNTYEQAGASGSFLRQTSKDLPGNPTSNPSFTYSYYGATDTRQNPCNASQTYKQAGMMKFKTEASPDGGTTPGRTMEMVYDDAGRLVASRYNSDDWTCMTYDSRGRISTTAIPAFNGAVARTVNNDYAVGGDPLNTATWDENGWIVSWVDLFGRTVKYHDVHGEETTTSYDAFGKTTQRVSPVGVMIYTYDSYSRLTTEKLDGLTYATITYDTYSRVQDITYSQAAPLSAPQIACTTSGSVSSGALTLALPTGTTNGDLLVMTASATLGTSSPPSFSVPSGWTQIQALTRTGTGSGNVQLQTWYKIANSEPANYAVTPSQNAVVAGSIMRITGADPGSPISSSNINTGSSSTINTPMVTAIRDNSLLVSALTWVQNATLTTTAPGYSQSYHIVASGQDNWGGSKAVANAGSYAGSQFKLSANVKNVITTIAINPKMLRLEQTKYDALQRATGMTYRLGDGTAYDETAVRSQSGRIVSDNQNGQAGSYTYDKAGRLTAATAGSHSYSYGYGAQDVSCGSGSNMNPNSGKNGNRTSQTIDGVSTTYCYDYADRLVSSSDPTANSTQYDSHGNMTSIGTNAKPLNLTYDSSDRNMGMANFDSSGNGVGMYYNRDASGRIDYRERDDITNWTWTLSSSYFYGFTGPGDSPDIVRDSNWNIIQKTVQLPGGVMLTIYPQQTGASQKQYSLSSLLGHTVLKTDATGANTSNGNGPMSSFTYDPFGNSIAGGNRPANIGDGSYGYGGGRQKFTEANLVLTPIQMGARVYFPTLGRFASVDQIDGGTANRYVYVLDPINGDDYSGLGVLVIAVFTIVGPIQGSTINPQKTASIQKVQPTGSVTRAQSTGTAGVATANTSVVRQIGVDISKIQQSPNARAGGPDMIPIMPKPFSVKDNLTSYFGCVFGVGTPIGVVYALPETVQLWPLVIKQSYNQSVQAERSVINYTNKVYEACSSYMNS